MKIICDDCGKEVSRSDVGMHDGKIVCDVCFMAHVMPCSKDEFNDGWDQARLDLKSEENEKGEA